MSMFEKASRLKLRFDTSKGMASASVEDLWDLPLTGKSLSLDTIALDLNRKLKETGDVVSFVDDTKKTDEVLQLKFELVKHIITVKKAEQAAATEAKVRAEKKQQILGLIAQKENEQLSQASIDELRSQLAQL